MKVSFYTLGCKVNQYETQIMREAFLKKGFTEARFDEPCDVCVINTCTVTAESDGKSRRITRRAKRLNPGAVVVMAGCFVQKSPDEAKSIEEADLLVGTPDKNRLADIVLDYLEKQDKAAFAAISDLSALREFEPMTATGFEERTRATVKIEDGCDNFCAYCAIPYARGRVRSKPLPDILSEIEALADHDYNEIVLTGIHLASYGKESGYSVTLADVLEQAGKIKGVRRLRLGSLEPGFITGDSARRMASVPSLCPHFHLSLQSGCDDTLKRMNRKYTAADYESAVRLLRKHFPDCAVTTDIIVGFPGETEEEFAESLSFVKKIGFAKAHIFIYSPREGTPAASMPDQVPKSVRKRRSELMTECARQSQQEYLKSFEGRILDVLFEAALSENEYEGLTKYYFPVRVSSSESLTNKTLSVKITGVCGEFCQGILPEPERKDDSDK